MADRRTLADRTIATGLEFPEGPVVVEDGSIIVVEIAGPRITRVRLDGTTEVIASWPDAGSAGPNGAALGPDGALYVCNNGGFVWSEANGIRFPRDPKTGGNQAPNYVSGSIDRVDLSTGAIETLYTECEGHRLCGPNDIVFDATGGFWFTDLGKERQWEVDKGGVFYARPDGSSVERWLYMDHPNGCGLSPDGSTLYVAQTTTGRLWSYPVLAPGQIDRAGGRCIANTLGMLDSMAVEADGTVVVAALRDGLLVAHPDGPHAFLAVDGPLITNIAFGGSDRTKAYITESGVGALLEIDWPRPGLALAF